MCVHIWVCVLYACERVSVTLFFFFSFLFFSGVIKMVKVSRSGYRIEMAMLTYVADCKIRAVFMLIFFLLLFFYLHSVAHTFYCHKFLNRVNTHTHTHRKYLYMCIYFRLHNRDFFFFTYIFFLFLLARAHTHICSFNSFFDGRTKKNMVKKRWFELLSLFLFLFLFEHVRCCFDLIESVEKNGIIPMRWIIDCFLLVVAIFFLFILFFYIYFWQCAVRLQNIWIRIWQWVSCTFRIKTTKTTTTTSFVGIKT